MSVLLPSVIKPPDLMVESWQVSWDRKLEVHVSGGYSYDATHAGPSRQARLPAGRRKDKGLGS
jgi:hypothetical protein